MATIYHFPSPLTQTVVETTVLYYLSAFIFAFDVEGAPMTFKLHGAIGLRHINGELADPRIAFDNGEVIMDARGLVEPLLAGLRKPHDQRQPQDPDLHRIYNIQIERLVGIKNAQAPEVRHA